MLKEIAYYLLKKYNSDIAKMIKDMECPAIDFPVCLAPRIIINLHVITSQEKIDEMDIYIWKKDYKLVHNKKGDFTKKEKRVFPIILDQCSPLLRSPLEGAKAFKEAHTKMTLLIY